MSEAYLLKLYLLTIPFICFGLGFIAGMLYIKSYAVKKASELVQIRLNETRRDD